MKKIFLNLFVYRDGRVSNTIFWSSVAYGVVSWAIIYLVLHDRFSVEYLLVYMSTVAGHTSLSKWLTAKYGSTVEKNKEN